MNRRPVAINVRSVVAPDGQPAVLLEVDGDYLEDATGTGFFLVASPRDAARIALELAAVAAQMLADQN